MNEIKKIRISVKNYDFLETKIKELRDVEKRYNEIVEEINSFKIEIQVIEEVKFQSDESGYNPNKL